MFRGERLLRFGHLLILPESRADALADDPTVLGMMNEERIGRFLRGVATFGDDETHVHCIY